MTRRTWAAGWLSSLVCAGALAAAADEPQPSELTGYAYDRESGAFLYTETHFRELREGRLVADRVEYRGPDHTLLAIKDLDYSSYPFAPDFRLRDLRDAYVEGAQHTDAGYRLFRQRPGEPEPKSELVPSGPDLVADSGFDGYLRAHLTELIHEPGTFRLAVAGRLTALAFRAELTSRGQLYGRDAVTFAVRPDSPLSWFVAPIYLTYDIGNGRLLRYAGISNIRSSSGDRYDARIDFPPDGIQPDTGTGRP